MPKIKEITVEFGLTVKPKDYNAVRSAASVTFCYTENEMLADDMAACVESIQEEISALVRDDIREQTRAIYGDAVAEFVLKQTGR